MYRIGDEEVEAVRRIIQEGQPFRYHEGSECERFERRWCQYLDAEYATMTASGSNALVAALKALTIGPGDEVLVPACTYMASAMAVLAVGAIPVVVDIDKTTTIDPQAVEDAIGPHTRVIMPVHMWGLSCDMNSLMSIARDHDLMVVEDACQAVGGAFEGKMLGTFGDVGVFSFNYYKNISCGEGGAVVTDDPQIHKRINCATDCCNFYWQGRDDTFHGFASNSARASEFEGAIMNVQLDRLTDLITTMRQHKKTIIRETDDVLQPAPCHSLDHECGCHVMYQFDSSSQANTFAEEANGTVLMNTGRHVYTEWDQVLEHNGAHHPALNPFNMPQNEECRSDYSPSMCSESLDIMNRTVKIANDPDRDDEELEELIETIRHAAQKTQ